MGLVDDLLTCISHMCYLMGPFHKCNGLLTIRVIVLQDTRGDGTHLQRYH